MTQGDFQFGDYRLDIPRRELSRGAELVVMQLKVFDTLAWLVEHRDRAVGRDELIAAVWGKVDVSDNVLGQIIGRARQAVGDDGSSQHCIRTMPRFGYRWVAETVVIDPTVSGSGASVPKAAPGNIATRPADHSESPAAALPPDPPIRPKSRPLPLRLALATVVVLGILLIIPNLRRAPDPVPGAANSARAGMVLPVVTDLDPDLAWMRLGVADFIAEQLRQHGRVVMPTESMVALSHGWHGPQPTQPELARLLRSGEVGMILRSQATRVGADWQIEIETIVGSGVVHKAQGNNHDVLVAARFAVDLLAQRLGFSPADSTPVPRNLSLDQVLQQVKAAILADDLDQARTLLDHIDDDLSRHPDVMLERAQIDLSSGQVERSLRVLTSLADDTHVSNDPTRHARVLHVLGQALFQHFDFDQARQTYSQAIALLSPPKNLQQNNLLGRILLSRGRVHLQLHQVDAGEADNSAARVALEDSGDQVGLARLNNNQAALLLYEKDQPETALPLMTKVAEQAELFHDASGEVRARINLLSIQRLLLDTNNARIEGARLEVLAAQIADPVLRQLAQLTRARMLTNDGQLSAARQILQANSQLTSGNSDPALVQFARALRAQLEYSVGRADLAQTSAEKALLPELEDADKREYALTWLTDIRSRRALGRLTEATEQTRRMQAWASHSNSRIPRLYASIALAEVSTANTQQTEANRAWLDVLNLDRDIRIPFEQLQVARSQTLWLLGHGQAQQAIAVVDRVAAFTPTNFDAALLQLQLYHALGQTQAWQAALARTRALAGERSLPDELMIAPRQQKP